MADAFTEKQKQIVELILQGKSNEEICVDVKLTLATIKYHTAILYKRAGVRSRSQFIVKMLTDRLNKT